MLSFSFFVSINSPMHPVWSCRLHTLSFPTTSLSKLHIFTKIMKRASYLRSNVIYLRLGHGRQLTIYLLNCFFLMCLIIVSHRYPIVGSISCYYKTPHRRAFRGRILFHWHQRQPSRYVFRSRSKNGQMFCSVIIVLPFSFSVNLKLFQISIKFFLCETCVL